MEKAVIFVTANEVIVSNKVYDYRDEILVDEHTGDWKGQRRERTMDELQSKKTVVSLFSGMGGFDMGFISAGYDIVKAIEIDAKIAALYRENVGPIECADLTAYDLSTLPQADVVIGGPPCQGFSVAGKTDSGDERSQLVFTFLDAVKHVQPTMFVMENVANLLRSKKFADVRERIQLVIKEMGYLVEILQLNAKHYGVAQSRERVFYIGYQAHIRCPTIPVEQPGLISGEVLRSLPQGFDSRYDCKAKITRMKKPILRKSPFAGMLFNGRGRPIDLTKPCNTLPATMGGNKTPIVDEKWLREEEEYIPWVIRYHQHLRVGGMPDWTVPCHLRRISVLEASALQGFPLDFRYTEKNSVCFKGIGNSVPPPLAAAIANQLIPCLTSER